MVVSKWLSGLSIVHCNTEFCDVLKTRHGAMAIDAPVSAAVSVFFSCHAVRCRASILRLVPPTSRESRCGCRPLVFLCMT